jgi:BatD DUF11 like domain
MQRRQLNIFILLLLFTGLYHSVTAQVKFTAKISPATIGKDETAELKLLVENAGDVQNILPPSLDKFIIISGPNQESGMESINGNTTQYSGITFILKPKGKGDFTIAPATASADGKILKSNAVKIKVLNEPTGNSISSNSPFSGLMNFDEPTIRRGNYNDYILKKGENITDKINRNIFIRVETSKTSCYVGEPILVTYKLYTRLKSESNITKNPSFNGFSVIDMLRSNDVYALVEKYNGREYNMYSLRQTQLYPLQSGNVELESASVENNIHFVKEDFFKTSRDDLFGNFSSLAIPAAAMVNEKVTLQSKPVVINVKPLPEQGKPVSFNGAVGNFSIHASLEKDSLTTDDAGKLFISVEGEGNLTLVNAPEFEWPAGVEVFDPKMKESLDKRSVPVSGNKTFEYNFTVNKEGNYTLQPLTYSFFDPSAAQYKTIATAPITFFVAKGSGKKTTAVEILQDQSAKENFFDTIFRNRWLLIAPLALLILAGLFIWIRWDKKQQLAALKEEQQKINIAEKKPAIKKPLTGSQAMLQHNDPRAFYSMLDKELKIFLGEKLQLPSEQLNRRTIGSALYNAGFADEDSTAVLQLLEDISVQLYTPVADESKAPYFYKKAEAVIHLFNSSKV